MTKPTCEDIIAAFDECLDFVYGRRWGRDNMHKTDMQTAQEWILAGVTVPLATIVFHTQMVRMHERWLHQHDLSDRSNIPGCLKIFDENIESAIRRQLAGGAELDVWEQVDSQWRARVKGWIKNPNAWNIDMWGPLPNANDCRVPKRVIAELVVGLSEFVEEKRTPI